MNQKNPITPLTPTEEAAQEKAASSEGYIMLGARLSSS